MTVPLVVVALASARVSRLLIDDVLIENQRKWVLARLHGKAFILATCPWCLSAYVSGALFLATWHYRPIPVPFISWLAVWWGTVFAYMVLENLHERLEAFYDED